MPDPYFATSPADLPAIEDLKNWTGLEYLQKMMAGEIAAPPISGLMNFSLEAAEFGRVVFPWGLVRRDFGQCFGLCGFGGGWQR